MPETLTPIAEILPAIVPAPVVGLLTPVALQQQVDMETQKRRILTEYISKHLKEGTDWGRIHIARDCKQRQDCPNPRHYSKAVLFKPGAEKFCSLFQLRPACRRDDDTWQMLGQMQGLVCYICELYTMSGEIAGEGRGAASVDEKGSPNVAIKIAQKRAKMDAVLSTGGLSDFFTQDLEEQGTDPEPEAVPGLGKAFLTRLFGLAKAQGIPEEVLAPWSHIMGQVDSRTALTSEQVNGLCQILKGQTPAGCVKQARDHAMRHVLASGWTKEEGLAWLKGVYGERPSDGYPLGALDRLCQHIRAGDEQREY
jgi:hypothetical protein